MARSRTKQGNRKHRVKVRNEDGTVQKDERGRPKTVGINRTLPDIWVLRERKEKLAAFWQRARDKREAEKVLAQEEAAQGLVGV